jgi:hypothetical protein
MKMTLLPFIPMLKSHSTGNHTRVDNIFCNDELVDSIVKCTTDDASRPVKTNHYPIITQLDIIAPKVTSKPRPNFRLANWLELISTLKNILNNLAPPTELMDTQRFNRTLNELNNTIQDAIRKHVKMSKPSPYSKRWWSTELASEKKKMQQLGGRVKFQQANPSHSVHEEYWQQCNCYSKKIQHVKAEHWIGWLKGLDKASVWQASKLMMAMPTDTGRTRISTLQVRDPTMKHILNRDAAVRFRTKVRT